MKRPEDKLQAECVLWFNQNYPFYRKCLFWVPNELIGKSTQYTKATCKTLGLQSGVSDLILAAPKGVTLFIELKTPKGLQSKGQKEFQKQLELNGHNYYIVRSLEEFKILVEVVF